MEQFPPDADLPAEEEEDLWIITFAPTIWAAHFLFTYISAAIWCAKYAGEEGSLGPIRVAIAIYTLVAVIGICIVGSIGYRRYSHGGVRTPHDDDTSHTRHRFLGFATLLLSVLSLIATLFVAIVAAFFRSCI